MLLCQRSVGDSFQSCLCMFLWLVSFPVGLRSTSFTLEPWVEGLANNNKKNTQDLVSKQIPVTSCHIVWVTFSVANTESPLGHMAVWMEDDWHDVPRRGKLRRGDVSTKYPKEVSLIFRYAIVDLYVVVRAAGMVLQFKVVESKKDRRTLCYHDQPGAVDVVGIKTREIWTWDIPRWRWEDPSTFNTW